MSDINPLLTQRPTINPYRYGAFEIWNRLQWDLNPESWRSRQKLKVCKDKYAGEKAVILCNGPSLLKSDLSLLNGVFTFGLNKINLLFDKSSFRPSCIVAVNPFVIEQNAEFYNQTDIPLYLDNKASKIISSNKNVTFVHTSSQYKFAQDCSCSLYTGFTVTFIAIQLAFHMGFQDVALIGCDHNFTTKGTPHKTVVSEKEDSNHFSPNYFSKGVKWQLPDIPHSEAVYSLAKDVYNLADRNIVNATEGGNLEVFPRVNLKDFVK